MKEALLLALSIALFGGGMLTLFEGKSPFFPSLRFLVLLAVLLPLLSPLLSFLQLAKEFAARPEDFFSYEGIFENGEVPDYQGIFESALLDYGKNESEAGLKQRITETFHLGAGDCTVAFLGEAGSFTAVTVTLSGKGVFLDSARVVRFVEEETGLPCHLRKE